MHDLDRTQLEVSDESLIFESESGEAQDYESPEADYEAPFTEEEEMQLAAELLEVQDEAQLDQFFGRVFRAARRGLGTLARSPLGKQLGGVLRKVAKASLPMVGGALGSMVGGPAGGLLGSKLATMAGNTFGLELEGMSAQDQQFEVAKRVVRLAGAAAQNANQLSDLPPDEAAQTAVVTAARRHAPGLVRPAPGGDFRPRPGYPPRSGYRAPHRCSCAGRALRGRWVRRGRYLVILGA